MKVNGFGFLILHLNLYVLKGNSGGILNIIVLFNFIYRLFNKSILVYKANCEGIAIQV
jgi:hypothetical protein